MQWASWALLVVVLAGLQVVHDRVHSALGPEGYMDEMFHLRQAQAYCRGEYAVWDGKITTYPGLYLLSSGLHGLARLVPGLDLVGPECSAGELRQGNVLLVALTYVACVLARKKSSSAGAAAAAAARGGAQDCSESAASAHLYALLIVLYPLSAFYYPLYYTDTASTCTLVLMYLVSSFGARQVGQSQISSFVLASAAIAVRQTNAVWVLFVVGANMLRELQQQQLLPLIEDQPYLSQLAAFVWALLRHPLQLARSNAGLISAVLWFVVLVLRNGGVVVVGDRENHRPALHAAMPLHLAAVTTATLGPSALLAGWEAVAAALPSRGDAASNSKPGWSSRLPTASAIAIHSLCTAAVSAALVLGSVEHPFLLADNRHYTFYLWRRLLRFPLWRAMLGPPYYLCLLFVARTMREAGRGKLWLTIYVVAAVLSLVPTPLLEPRYWTPGVVVILLNAPSARSTAQLGALAVSVALCLAINAAATHVFLERTFVGPDGQLARFMY